ncbi:hypothetical protein, partial [Klebsiella pneumoniae]|uniref:hypothetical protein n=1 Tax=Klebsiella pneumoniae TaxID=573 RepID=UPI001D0E265D
DKNVLHGDFRADEAGAFGYAPMAGVIIEQPGAVPGTADRRMSARAGSLPGRLQPLPQGRVAHLQHLE